ncbi:MAG: glycoside hydrolase family 5 protein [Candidatus Protochlamydia sp.]|nr:glycoside hydrolase family 5 protein [Candidatus Protochlamydia sp.]
MIYKLLFVCLTSWMMCTNLCAKDDPLGWRTSGSQIVNPEGEAVILRSVSWFGFETQNHVVHGLWSRNMQQMLDEIKAVGFNSIRLPYSNDILKPGAMPDSINTWENKDLAGKTALEVFDIFIAEASKRGLYIILDRHRPTSAQQSELWYTSEVPEIKWIEDWVFLADRYKSNPCVIAADLHNEPHGSAEWGTGEASKDWKAAAERAGNAILMANPRMLIIVEGIQYDKNHQAYWWGGSLDQVKKQPIKLSISNKVIYSPHDYGAGVWLQPWFNVPDFPNNMEQIWHAQWGYIAKENIAPLWIGEFGGRKVDFKSKEGLWQNKLVQYIHQNGISFSYWSWNPNSGDTGGILQDDWKSLNQDKVDMLKLILE